MSLQSFLKWKDHTAPKFIRGSTFYAAHPDYLRGMTWAQLPLAPTYSSPDISIFSASAQESGFPSDTSVIGVINPEEATLHSAPPLNPDDIRDALYLCVIIRSPTHDNGQFRKALQNLKIVIDSRGGAPSTEYPFPLISDDGEGIRLHQRIWEIENRALDYRIMRGESVLTRVAFNGDHDFIPIEESHYAALAESGYKFVRDFEKYLTNMSQGGRREQVVFGNSYENPTPMMLVKRAEGHVVGVSFVISSTGPHDVSGEIKELVLITRNG